MIRGCQRCRTGTPCSHLESGDRRGQLRGWQASTIGLAGKDFVRQQPAGVYKIEPVPADQRKARLQLITFSPPTCHLPSCSADHPCALPSASGVTSERFRHSIAEVLEGKASRIYGLVGKIGVFHGMEVSAQALHEGHEARGWKADAQLTL